MRYLIDTQILLWIFGESDKLTTTATQIVKDKKTVYVLVRLAFGK